LGSENWSQSNLSVSQCSNEVAAPSQGNHIDEEDSQIQWNVAIIENGGGRPKLPASNLSLRIVMPHFAQQMIEPLICVWMAGLLH
jgi:hypothetical protein